MRSDFFWNAQHTTTVVHGEHDPWLVLLSLVISVLASAQALRMAELAQHAITARQRHGALLSGSLALGAGIWAMHFIGMLAFSLQHATRYDIPLTLLSMLPGVLASWVALWLLARSHLRPLELAGGGVLVGLGIGAMHYSGMAATHTDFQMRYSLPWFVASFMIAVVLATAALWIRFGLAERAARLGNWSKAAAALVMGASIAGMHYTGMMAVRFTSEVALPHSASNTENTYTLALTIALVTLVVGALVDFSNGRTHYRALWQRVDANETRLRSIFHMAVDGIVTIDHTGLILSYNPAAQAIFGWTDDEVFGRSVTMLMPTPVADEHDVYLKLNGETSQARLLGTAREVLGLHKSGRLIPLRLAVSLVSSTPGQRMFVGFLTDLSESKKTEAQLRVAATVFNHCNESVVVLDVNRRVVDVNPAYERMCGLTRKDVRNKEFLEFYEAHNPDMQFDLMWKQLAQSGHWQGDWCCAFGQWHRLSLTAVRDERDRIRHYIGIFSLTNRGSEGVAPR